MLTTGAFSGVLVCKPVLDPDRCVIHPSASIIGRAPSALLKVDLTTALVALMVIAIAIACMVDQTIATAGKYVVSLYLLPTYSYG